MKKCILFLTMFYLVDKSGAQVDSRTNTSSKKQNLNLIDARRKRNVAFAQQTLVYSPLSYVCPPYFDLGSPKKYYILSADIIPEFIISSSRIPVSIRLTARYMVRILHNDEAAGDTSLPVRTPSFMPGATVFIPLNKVYKRSEKLDYAGISLFHHSNGQDGPEFHSDGSFNLYNGNFSTNYIEPSYHFRRRKYLTDTVITKKPSASYNDIYGSVGVEFHFGTADALKSSYGEQRLNIMLGFLNVINHSEKYHGSKPGPQYYGENFRFVFHSTFVAGHRDKGLSAFDKRINADINFYWRLKGSPNTSLFTGTGYYGSDPYNIYYANSYFFIRAGIALGFFIAPHLN
jgi:hypothetical protein